MKNRRFASRFLAAALTCAMMSSLVVSASASVTGNCAYNDAAVRGLEDGPATGQATCVPAGDEQTQPDYLTGQVANRQDANPNPDMLSPIPNDTSTAPAKNTTCTGMSSSTLGEPPLPPITTTPPLAAENELHQDTSMAVSAEELLALQERLGDIYFLEARVMTLEDYNTFDPVHGYFVFKNDSDVPHSICEKLNPADRKHIATLSTYQALLYIKQTKEYQTDEELRKRTDDVFDNFTNFMPPYVRESMTGFVPRAISDQLDPDQLVAIGNLIVGTEKYQQLKIALAPMRDYYTVATLTEKYSTAEITLIYDEIISAAMAIWPQGAPDRGLAAGVKADGSQTLVLMPDPVNVDVTGAAGN